MWKPTHLSATDGSDARLVKTLPDWSMVMENECGDRWTDEPGSWIPIEEFKGVIL